ncbi:MAG: invasion associated locus B family protein [Alphaproteobacteria bacterium]
MIAQLATIALLLCVSSSAALAQRDPRPPRFLPEKLSPHPVQPTMSEAPARLSAAANPDRGQIVLSPWVKFCGRDQNDPHGKVVCLTVKEVRLGSHAERFLAGVALIESAGEDKKILRVTLPADLQRSAPARLRVDDDIARSGELRRCLSNGCFWDFPADAAFVTRLRTGDRLHVEGAAASGEIASYDLPLAGFARANEGRPTDPAAFKDEQRRREGRSRDPSMQPR